MTEAPRVAICAIAKNEGPYLEEWAVYHNMLGFDPIRVYSHEPEDDSEEVLAGLERRGLLEWTPWTAPPEKKPQWVAYEDGLKVLDGRTDWVAFIDLDEFIVLPQHDSIQAFLADHPHFDAIAMNWKMFGSSGRHKREPGLVIDRFRRCARRDFSGNRQVKTLAKLEAVVEPRVHTCHFRSGTKYQSVSGEVLPPVKPEKPDYPVGRSEKVSHDLIRINHYFTRSREEWDEKARRGRGAKPANHPLKHRTPAEFRRNDHNEKTEVDIVELIPEVRKRMDGEVPDAQEPERPLSDGGPLDGMAFICGCGHSGTSLLANMFAAHPQVHVPLFETNVFLGRSEAEAGARLPDLVAEAEAEEKSYLVEKTPRHLRQTERIRKSVKDPRIIIIVRDGRDVAASFEKRNPGPGLRAGIRRWIHDNEIAREQESHDDVCISRYEDLIVDPEAELKRLCEFAGIPFSPAMLEYHKEKRDWFGVNAEGKEGEPPEDHQGKRNWQINQPIFDSRGRWKETLSEQNVKPLTAGKGKSLMEHFGYLEDESS